MIGPFHVTCFAFFGNVDTCARKHMFACPWSQKKTGTICTTDHSRFEHTVDVENSVVCKFVVSSRSKRHIPSSNCIDVVQNTSEQTMNMSMMINLKWIQTLFDYNISTKVNDNARLM